jgi:hypothetical protein
MRERGRRAGGAALADAALDAGRRSLAARCDEPVRRSLLLAPPEDDVLSTEEAAKLAKAWADSHAGA